MQILPEVHHVAASKGVNILENIIQLLNDSKQAKRFILKFKKSPTFDKYFSKLQVISAGTLTNSLASKLDSLPSLPSMLQRSVNI